MNLCYLEEENEASFATHASNTKYVCVCPFNCLKLRTIAEKKDEIKKHLYLNIR